MRPINHPLSDRQRNTLAVSRARESVRHISNPAPSRWHGIAQDVAALLTLAALGIVSLLWLDFIF